MQISLAWKKTFASMSYFNSNPFEWGARRLWFDFRTFLREETSRRIFCWRGLISNVCLRREAAILWKLIASSPFSVYSPPARWHPPLIEIVHCSILRITPLFCLQMFVIEKFGFFINFRCLYIAGRETITMQGPMSISSQHLLTCSFHKRSPSVSVLF